MKLLILSLIAVVHLSQCAEFEEVFAWKNVDFVWPDEQFKQEALKTGAFVQENNLILGLAPWKDKLFITVPRWKAGVGSSLNYVKIGSNEKSPKLIPYPSWDANYIPAENGSSPAEASTGGRTNAPKAEGEGNLLKSNSSIVSVFRLWVDKCDRLWVMDTGLADILGAPKIIATPSLVIFDLNKDTLIRRYFFKKSDIKENSFLANVIVDVTPETCDDAFAYVPDLGGYGLVVYSFKEDKSWRIKHHYFHFDPLAGQYKVGGVDFQWTDGIFGAALGKRQDSYRKVFFHALSSTKEFEVSSRVLQNETWATNPDNFHDFKLVGERGPNSQATANYFDEENGVLFYTQVNKNGLACWNAAKPLTPETTALIVNSEESLEFPNDMKVDDHGTIWLLSDKLPKFIYRGLNNDDVNYRVLNVNVKDAIRGTVCA